MGEGEFELGYLRRGPVLPSTPLLVGGVLAKAGGVDSDMIEFWPSNEIKARVHFVLRMYLSSREMCGTSRANPI